METFGIVLGVILGVVLLFVAMIAVGGSIQEKNRRAKCKNWQIGDKLILNKGEYYDEMVKNKEDYAILKGWSLDNLYISCGGGYIHKTSWACLSSNKSSDWRQNYEEAKKVMGCDPEFPNGVGVSTTSNGNIDGKPIETMSEIECEVQLKLAIENEDYPLAEKIRKRLERFR